MKCKIEYEFEIDLQKGEEYNHEVVDCIEEDAGEAIKAAINNIVSGVKEISYKVTRL